MSVARALGICGVRHKSKDASAPQLAEAGKVDDLAVDRGVIHLEIAGVYDDTGRSVYSHSHRIGDRVVDLDEFNCHTAHFHGLFGLHYIEADLSGQALLLELGLDKADSQSRGINGDVHPFQQVSQTADVVLMAVGDDDATDLVGIALDVGKIGDNDVNAGHIGVGEGKSAVQYDHIIGAFKDGHVLADLVEASQRDDPYGSLLDLLGACGAGALCRSLSSALLDNSGLCRSLFLNGTLSGPGRSRGSASAWLFN